MNAFKSVFHRWLFLRFLIVGLGNTAASFLIFSGLVLLGVHYTLANFVALIAGIGISYISNGTLVFKGLSLQSFLRYVAMWAALYGIQIIIIWGTLRVLGPELYQIGPVSVPVEVLGGFCALVVSVPSSFVLQRFFVFADASQRGGSPGQ